LILQWAFLSGIVSGGWDLASKTLNKAGKSANSKLRMLIIEPPGAFALIKKTKVPGNRIVCQIQLSVGDKVEVRPRLSRHPVSAHMIPWLSPRCRWNCGAI